MIGRLLQRSAVLSSSVFACSSESQACCSLLERLLAPKACSLRLQQPSHEIVAAASGQHHSYSGSANAASQTASASTAATASDASPASTSSGPQSTAHSTHAGADYDAMALFSRSRYTVAYQEMLYRELMLKTSPRLWTSVPKLRSIKLTISALQDTRLERSVLPYADLLLYQLALEMIAAQPASFVEPTGQKGTGKAEGVTVTLTGQPMMDFLEKLVYVVLPNQIGFEGATQPQEVPGKPPRPGKQPIVTTKEAKTYFSEIKVTNLMLYPDFEQSFELFEQLRSMQVRIEVGGADSPEIAGVFLSGLALPLKTTEQPEES